MPPDRRKVRLLHLPHQPPSPPCLRLCQMWGILPQPSATFIDTTFLCHFTGELCVSQAAEGQSTANIDLSYSSSPDKPWTFTAPPQLVCPSHLFTPQECQDLRPAPGSSRATLVFLPSHLATWQGLDGLMFQETPREVNSGFPLIHQKGAKKVSSWWVPAAQWGVERGCVLLYKYFHSE